MHTTKGKRGTVFFVCFAPNCNYKLFVELWSEFVNVEGCEHIYKPMMSLYFGLYLCYLIVVPTIVFYNTVSYGEGLQHGWGVEFCDHRMDKNEYGGYGRKSKAIVLFVAWWIF